jgi:hypothetical protein
MPVISRYSAGVATWRPRASTICFMDRNASRFDDGLATLAIEVTCDGQKVLGMPKAVVRA